MSRNGILAGGNWIVDHVKLINTWPPQDALASILTQSDGNGGSAYNLLKNLSRLGACAAAASLRSPTCSDSVESAAACLDLGRSHGFHADGAH